MGLGLGRNGRQHWANRARWAASRGDAVRGVRPEKKGKARRKRRSTVLCAACRVCEARQKTRAGVVQNGGVAETEAVRHVGGAHASCCGVTRNGGVTKIEYVMDGEGRA
ncbi:hypothetical protein U1Q18_008119 [Sarracenia purpurea var. burkii]